MRGGESVPDGGHRDPSTGTGTGPRPAANRQERIMAQMAIAIALSDTIPMRLGLLAVAYVGIAFVVHDALHRHLVDSVRSRHVAEELALQLNRFESTPPSPGGRPTKHPSPL